MTNALHLPSILSTHELQEPSPFTDLFAPYVENAAVEWALVAGLDSLGRLRCFFGHDGFRGSNTHLIPCVRAALASASVCVIVIAHNHPSGPAMPSREDIAATRQVAALCRMANARLLDHLIYAPDTVTSLRAMGVLH